MKKLLKSLLLSVLLLLAGYVDAQIVFSDFSDPDVCEGSNNDYWMTASSFQCIPGLPILHSTDLINWTLAGYAVQHLLPSDHYSLPQHGNGVWAPSIRRHNDTYYIYWGDPDYGVFMVSAKSPRGPWTEPVLVLSAKGVIDTCPLWDDDGRVYLVNGWANSRCGFNAVLTIRELSADGTKVIGKPRIVYDGQINGDYTIEGPKIYKYNGFYYILAPAGGVEKGWQVALRSRSVYGPYERKVVFNEEGIHQGGLTGISTGRALPSHFICFQEKQPYGRILHLLDVEWNDGWPMMRKSKADSNETKDKFGNRYWNGNQLPAEDGVSHYQWHANYTDIYGMPLLDCGHRVYSHTVGSSERINLWNVPNLWLRKFDGEVFSDTLRLRITSRTNGQSAGFTIMGRDYCRLSATLSEDGKYEISYCVCKNADKNGQEVTRILESGIEPRKYIVGANANYEIYVDVILNVKKNGVCSISYLPNKVNASIISLKSKHETATKSAKEFRKVPSDFQAREGKWIGAKYGVFCISPVDNQRSWCDLLEN